MAPQSSSLPCRIENVQPRNACTMTANSAILRAVASRILGAARLRLLMRLPLTLSVSGPEIAFGKTAARSVVGVAVPQATATESLAAARHDLRPLDSHDAGDPILARTEDERIVGSSPLLPIAVDRHALHEGHGVGLGDEERGPRRLCLVGVFAGRGEDVP